MSANLRPYKDLFPQTGQRVMIDATSVAIGDVRMADDVSIWPLIIGEEVTVGHKVMLHGCTIGNRVLVGMGSILLDGVVVEDDVMIGAGSLVPQNKRLESGYLYFGNPVKQIRPLTEAERAGLLYSANNYVKWKNDYLDQETHTQP
ncbi:TPA: gamma carbonic anhydrase family protein [Raoultella ornithinolytica]|nr:gamma carbonic anhydrase family protein [Raoultella ornithinolytica]